MQQLQTFLQLPNLRRIGSRLHHCHDEKHNSKQWM
jgi:hypothetical protein